MSTSIVPSNGTSHAYLSRDALMHQAPAVFASHQFERTSENYIFISTSELVDALQEAGFQAVDARQRRSRGERFGYARHMLRFQPADQSLRIVDCMPEIILINSHDATSAWELRGGLYRFACCNGLIVALSELTVIRVPHRGNVIASVVEGARRITEQLGGIGYLIERMIATELDQARQQAFAQKALELRYRRQDGFPFEASRLLEARQDADRADNLWAVYNKVQQNVIRGGIAGRTVAGRKSTSRGIRAIEEDVRLNVALWRQAMALI